MTEDDIDAAIVAAIARLAGAQERLAAAAEGQLEVSQAHLAVAIRQLQSTAETERALVTLMAADGGQDQSGGGQSVAH